MIRYLIDSSALWRIMRDEAIRSRWSPFLAEGVIGSCHPQRTEFRRSARSRDEYEQMTHMFADLYPDVPVPKRAWTWIEAAQYQLLRAGAHRALPIVDLLMCAASAHHGLMILHDDHHFATAARILEELHERRV